MSDDRLRLDGRVAVVTGATAGIGEATASALAGAGAHVLVVGRHADRGHEVVDKITADGGDAVYHPADMHSTSDIDAMIDAAVSTWGGLDIAFNNAGIFDRMHNFHNYDDDAWDEMITVNLSAVFRCMRAEIDAMLTTGGGSIVNNASTVAHRGSQRASPAYVAAKHGVLGITKQAAVEYAARSIRVNAVSPGPTRTAVADPLIAEGPQAVRSALSTLNPMSDFVAPNDIADTVVFLCSDAAKMINGHAIALDGGQLAQL